ncbi:hypothetical protein BGZ83_003319, partial [Gryganskiella cystojenkinii]
MARERELPQPWTGSDFECGFPVTLLPELRMRAASNAIREKPLWWEKLKDLEIAEKWKRELMGSNITPTATDAAAAAPEDDHHPVDAAANEEQPTSQVQENGSTTEDRTDEDEAMETDDVTEESGTEEEEEAEDSGSEADDVHNFLTEEQVHYVFQELAWYADQRQQQVEQGVDALIERAIDGTRRSDGLIPDELKQRLLTC